MSLKILGADIALNHGAFVMLEDGLLARSSYYTDKKSVAKAGLGTWMDLSRYRKGDKKTFEVARLDWLSQHFLATLEFCDPDFVAIEDYTFGSKSASHYQIGEAGGVIRLFCFRRDIPFRLYDPGSWKMYVAHNGAAQKEDVAAAVKTRWGVEFGAKRDPEGDLADAYAIARTLEFELGLRRGDVTLAGRHPKEIEMVNRVTKANPVNLLSRPFVMRDGWNIDEIIGRVA